MNDNSSPKKTSANATRGVAPAAAPGPLASPHFSGVMLLLLAPIILLTWQALRVFQHQDMTEFLVAGAFCFIVGAIYYLNPQLVASGMEIPEDAVERAKFYRRTNIRALLFAVMILLGVGFMVVIKNPDEYAMPSQQSSSP